MNRVAIVQFVRLASQRVPRKLLEPVGNVSLLDRGLDYLQRLATTTGAVPFLAAHPKDAILQSAAARHGLHLLTIPAAAETARIWPDLIAPFAELLRDRFDVVWDANVCCRPFLRQTTGEFIVRQCQATRRPLVGVTRKRGIVWSETSPTPILGDGHLADTTQNPNYFELAHLAYCWPTWALSLPESQLADLVQPLELHLDWAEHIDIDTPADLAHARAIAQSGVLADDR